MSDTGAAVARLVNLCAVDADTPGWLRAVREARQALRRRVGGRGWVFEVEMGECATRVAILRDGFAVTVGPGDPVDARLAGSPPAVASALLGYTTLDDALDSGLLTVAPTTDLQRLRRIAEVVSERLRELVAGAAPVVVVWRRLGARSQRWRVAAQAELIAAPDRVAAAMLAVTMMAASVSPLLSADPGHPGTPAGIPGRYTASAKAPPADSGNVRAAAESPPPALEAATPPQAPQPGGSSSADDVGGLRAADQGQSVRAAVEGGTPGPATEHLAIASNGYRFEVEVYCDTTARALACAAARAAAGPTPGS